METNTAIETTSDIYGHKYRCTECRQTGRGADKKICDAATAKIKHNSDCSYFAAPVAIDDTAIRTLAADVRRTGLTTGRDSDVLDAVRAGYLSVDDAMNTDD